MIADDQEILDINGNKPRGYHFKPTEWWWPNQDPDRRMRNVDSRYNFGIVHLADGRFASSTFVGDIKRGIGVHADRTAAIRAAAAENLLTARAARHWTASWLHPAHFTLVWNWTLRTVARETLRPESRAYVPKPPPPPPPPEHNLPLWQAAARKSK